MTSGNGDQGHQSWPQPAGSEQPQSSDWGPSSEQGTPNAPADDDPAIAQPMSTPAETPASAESESAQSRVPEGPSADDDRTQAFSRPDLRFDQPAPAPTVQMPAFPPPPPGASYQPQSAPSAYPPPVAQAAPAPPPQQGYSPPTPYQPGPQAYQPEPQAQPSYQPEPPAQTGWAPQQPAPGFGQAPYQPAPGFGQAPYQPEPAYPQQPYGAPPAGYGQYGAPYGQQPYSPYPPGPPKKRRVGLWIGVSAVVVIAALAIVAFAAKPGFLGFKKVLDHSAVEQTIEKAGYTNVACNGGKNPTVKKGATFTCTADGGKKVTVTITKANGDYIWQQG